MARGRQVVAWTPGPSPRKRIDCGYCSALKEKEKRLLDSCPTCGKSFYAFRKYNSHK